MSEDPRDIEMEEFATALAVGQDVYIRPPHDSKQLLELEEQARHLNRLLVKCAKLYSNQYRVDPQSPLSAHIKPVISTPGLSVDATRNEQAVSPATKWLLDNLPIANEYLQEACEELPKCDYGSLPKLKEGHFAGFPRIYRMAVCLALRLNNRLELGAVRQFILAYQNITPLTNSELWSFIGILWLVLAENLRRIVTQVITAHGQYGEAGALSNNLLKGVGPRLEELNLLQTKTENILAAMRSLSTINGPAFLESISPVDLVLRKDPADTYPLMEFATRDCYRQVIEYIAEKMSMTERDIAQCAVDLASESRSLYPDYKYLAHVGYYLIDAGRVKLDEKIGYQSCLRERLSRAAWRNVSGFCLGAVAVLTSLILALLLLYAFHVGASAPTFIWLPALLVVPASELAVNVLFTILISRPSLLPKMDFTRGLPKESQTMVVVPTIFSSEAVVREVLESIEAHYLANRDDYIFFALLGDWNDAPQEKMTDDDALLNLAMNGIKNLNVRYSNGASDRFYLFHRRRQWNQGEQKWMGWERKRGKLQEFNHLIRGARDTSYIVCTADKDFLAQIRYVITVDSDTVIPRDVARRLIATISHPLNRPMLDVSSGRLLRGYAIVQPLPNPVPPRAARSRIPMILSNYVRVEPRLITPMNIYQDLFSEGLYVGKGIYDVDTFERMLEGRIPDNSLLSHDICEGLYARTALAADIVVFEDYPASYRDLRRLLHRWTRGDWQFLPWVMPYMRDARGKIVRNALPPISRWKIFELQRRSLFVPAILLWLVAAWIVLPGSPLAWTSLILLLFASSSWLPAVKMDFLMRRREITQNNPFESVQHVAKFGVAALRQAGTGMQFFIIFLADQAYYTADGIVRTLYRMAVSRKRLLEWVPTAQAQKEVIQGLRAYVTLMWHTVVIALLVGGLIVAFNPAALIPAAPILIAWFLSPLKAYWIDSRRGRFDVTLRVNIEGAIRLNGCRAWRGIEDFPNNIGNRRPSPESYQENHETIIPRHTLPTRHLRDLLWLVTAYDFGRIGTVELAERLEYTFAEINMCRRMFNYRHNGGNIQALNLPSMRSIVGIESGNLASYLTKLKNTIMEIVNRPLFDGRMLDGFADTITLMKERMTYFSAIPRVIEEVIYRQLHSEVETCAAIILQQKRKGAPQSLTEWRNFFNLLARRAAAIDSRSRTLSLEFGASNGEFRYWADSLISQTREFMRDLSLLTPWASAGIASLKGAVDDSGANALGDMSNIVELFDRVPYISRTTESSRLALNKLAALREINKCADVLDESDALIGAVKDTVEFSQKLLLRFAYLTDQCESIVGLMDYQPLFDVEYSIVWAKSQFSSHTRLANTVINKAYAKAAVDAGDRS